MMELKGTLEPELGGPLVRAILRLEGELLAQDEVLGNPDPPTAEQRAADAFVLLAECLTSEPGAG